VRIRPAAPDDAHAVGRVHVETWRAAYRGLVSDAYLASLSPAQRAGQWDGFLADRSGARFVFVADDDVDGLIGFAAAGPERSGGPNHRGELYALYVVPSHQRQGVGRGLLRAVAGRLVAAGTRSMLLWVLEANPRARAFYEALGGVVVRAQPIEIGGATFTEVAYAWPELAAIVAD
jgi:ribosomal protein S18 acetylase RimI-like enzyme